MPKVFCRIKSSDDDSNRVRKNIESLSSLTNLTAFSTGGVPVAHPEIFGELAKLSSLRRLELCFNATDSHEVYVIERALLELTTLKSLDVRKLKNSSDDSTALLKTLLALTHLENWQPS